MSLNSAAASSSICSRGPAKPSLQESLACSCPRSKWTKDAGSGWQSLPTWDCLSQQGTVMKLALRAVPVFRLFVPQCCSVQGYNMAWNQTWLKGAASGGVRPCCTAAPRGSLQAFPPHMAFAVWDGNFTKLSCTGQVPRNIRTLKCLYLITGSGMTYSDRSDCTTA